MHIQQQLLFYQFEIKKSTTNLYLLLGMGKKTFIISTLKGATSKKSSYITIGKKPVKKRLRLEFFKFFNQNNI